MRKELTFKTMNMKKLLFVLASAVLLASCGSVSQIEERDRGVYVMFQDFRPFEEQGFLLTPNMFSGEYSSCGLLEIHVFPAKKVDKTSGGTNKYGNYVIGSSTVKTEEISSEELISIAVEKAKSLGADAICNFKCGAKYSTYTDSQGYRHEDFSHYEISGFCIKRK